MHKFKTFITESSEYRNKYFAWFVNHLEGPYDSEEEAWNDTGGDVEWIKKGSDLEGKNKSRAKKLMDN